MEKLQPSMQRAYERNVLADEKKDVKTDEERVLLAFSKRLYEHSESLSLCDYWFFGYEIPRISKEFDLLRFGKDCVINVELKRMADEEKIVKQLIQNRSYLSVLHLPVHSFTYVADEDQLWCYEDGELSESSFEDLALLIAGQKRMHVENPDELFAPAAYLISVLNEPERFLARTYFLTAQQEAFRKEINESLPNGKFLIRGEFGTGKTLLLYDLLRTVTEEKKYSVSLIHCGTLCRGHEVLKEAGLEIFDQSILNDESFHRDVLLLDEAHRLSDEQYEKLLESDSAIVMAEDKNFNPREDHEVTVLSLTHKIRVNRETAGFVSALFYLPSAERGVFCPSAQLIGLDREEELQETVYYLKSKGYKFLSAIHPDAVHPDDVLGQEFDRVAVLADDRFYYDHNGRLSSKRNEKDTEELYDSMTRVRHEIALIVYQNPQLLNAMASVFAST